MADDQPAPLRPPGRHDAVKPRLGPRADFVSTMPVTDPANRIVFGVVLVAVGAVMWNVESLERVKYWMLLISLFGFFMMRSGAAQRQHDARVRFEIDRGEREWPELLRDAATARRDGASIVRMLQQRGYREFFVRRWLADRIEHELAQGDAAETRAREP